jgi:hypothetical protein
LSGRSARQGRGKERILRSKEDGTALHINIRKPPNTLKREGGKRG